ENPISVALNTKPKYVVSNTFTDPHWEDTTVLSGDVAAAIRELKARPDGELQVHGSGGLTRWLLDNDLVDEMHLLICPVVVGQGGDRLHEWAMAGAAAGATGVPKLVAEGVNGQIANEFMSTGALVAGRATFELANGWGGDHHDRVPIFIYSRGQPGIDISGWP